MRHEPITDGAVYALAQGADLESQLRAEIDRAREEALVRCPGAALTIDRMVRALRGRVTRLRKAQRRLEGLGKKRAERERAQDREDGSHGR